jgi:phosphoribosyl 1,2-cyclic phosphodiesterase
VRFAVLGSGSRGNAVAIRTDASTLVVDAGFGPRALARRAAMAGVPLEPLAGIVLTHEHGDHARGAATLARRLGCLLFATPGTLAALALDPDLTCPLPPLGEALPIGPFLVEVARTAHDAREPVAVAVSDATGCRVGIAWDLGRPTAAVRHLLRHAAALIVEANHDEVMLQTGPYPASVRQRIGGSTGHLSNRLAAELLADVWSPGLETVILAHLSEQCNDGTLARRTVAGALRARGFRGQVLVAGQHTPLPAVSLRPRGQLTLPLPAAPPTPNASPSAPAPTPGSSA